MFQNLVTFLTLACSLSVTFAAPIQVREVPQEHSHEQFLTSVGKSLQLNNPNGILDPVFGLLGNAAAAKGLGKLTDATCLQQATADQAFSNAKAAGDVQGQVDALIYRALERNSGKVGLVTAPCTSLKAVNPEIAAIQQHQDPASANAAAVNKAIVLELAKQIAAVGGNPQDALKSGTFKPGNVNDPTAKGNTCDTTNDSIGCIFSQNLLVPDATAAEIDAAVAGVAKGAAAAANTGATNTGAANTGAANTGAANTGAGNNKGNNKGKNKGKKGKGNKGAGNKGAAANNGGAAAAAGTSTTDNTAANNGGAAAAAGTSTTNNSAACSVVTTTVTVAPVAEATPAAGNGNVARAARASGNLQKFTGALGGATAPPVNVGGRAFQVTGSDSFLTVKAALGRSCDIQHNKCASIANSAAGRSQGLTVSKCDQQNTACRALI